MDAIDAANQITAFTRLGEDLALGLTEQAVAERIATRQEQAQRNTRGMQRAPQAANDAPTQSDAPSPPEIPETGETKDELVPA